jgi:hypothetical protein
MMRRFTLFGALLVLTLGVAAPAHAAFSDYGLESVTASLSNTQAGGHPDFTVGFRLKTDPVTHALYATTRDFTVGLPPGLIGNPHVVEQCTDAQLFGGIEENAEGCPQDSQVGISKVTTLSGFTFTDPVFNMVPPANGPAQLGLYAGPFPVLINIGVRSDSDYGLNSMIEGIPTFEEVIASQTTIWAVPASPVHDTERLTIFEGFAGATHSPPRKSGLAAELPFFQNATHCGEPQDVFVETDSYQEPGHFVRMDTSLPPLSGCGSLAFGPTLSVAPTTREAAAPSGLDVELSIPQDETLTGRATSQLRDTKITFPPGMTLAPGAAAGLVACSDAQVGYGISPPTTSACPPASTLGRAEFDVPQLTHPIDATMYLRTPVPGDLFRVWLVSDELGVHVKIPGDIQLDPNTGQVTSLFLNTPQVPLSHLRLHLFGGAHGPLATPPACGTYETHYEFTPWSGTPSVTGETPMTFDQNCATASFAPQLSAGTLNPSAGSFSPFVLKLDQRSGEQQLNVMETTLPPGLTAKLAGVPLCPDQAAASGDCPAGSQIGTAQVATGVGPTPLWLPQPGDEPITVYLAGPYEGAPFSIVVKTPAQAGPFNLGTIVVRAALYIDPHTAQVTIKTDPLPRIVQGIPIVYRTIYVNVDRPSFTLNPTNCQETSVTGTVTSSTGQAASIGQRFQAADCSALAFKPGFAVSTAGKTSKANGASLSVKLTYPNTPQGTQANIHLVKVELPKQLPSRLTTLQKACTAAQFNTNPAGCPAASVVGHAKAITPILPVPLEGPAYFVSHGGEAFPSLILVLQGYGVTIDLIGATSISKTGVTSSTFKTVPDQPVTSFELTLPQGKFSALAANGNLCASKLVMPTEFIAQNGAVINQSTPIAVAGCSSSISVVSHSLRDRNLTISVSVPAAGKLAATGKGLSKASKTSKGRETVKLTLHTTKSGKLSTKVKLTFTPSTGKDRRKQSKALKVAFKK